MRVTKSRVDLYFNSYLKENSILPSYSISLTTSSFEINLQYGTEYLSVLLVLQYLSVHVQS